MANAMRLRPAGKKASQAASQPANGSNGAHCQQPNANPDSDADADADSMLMQTHSQPASQPAATVEQQAHLRLATQRVNSVALFLAAFSCWPPSTRIGSTPLHLPSHRSTRLGSPANRRPTTRSPLQEPLCNCSPRASPELGEISSRLAARNSLALWRLHHLASLQSTRSARN